MRFPTGGIAHEPQGMIRRDSEADSIVWMKEDRERDKRYGRMQYQIFVGYQLWNSDCFRAF